jgi:transcriptional regulator with XRE-family HTH domain
MATIINRLLQYIDSQTISGREFERKTGLTNGTIGKLRKGVVLGADKLEKICVIFPDINPIWLMTGVGNMIQETDNYVPENVPDNVYENVPKNVQQTKNEIGDCENCIEKGVIITDLRLDKETLISEKREFKEERNEIKEEFRNYKEESTKELKEYREELKQRREELKTYKQEIMSLKSDIVKYKATITDLRNELDIIQGDQKSKAAG